MYPQPPERPPPWWAEVLVLTRAVFGVLFWPLVAIVGAVGALVVTVYLFTVHWAAGVAALGVVLAAVAAFAWWDSHRPPQLPV